MQFSFDHVAVRNAEQDAMEGVAESARANRAGLSELRCASGRPYSSDPARIFLKTDGNLSMGRCRLLFKVPDQENLRDWRESSFFYGTVQLETNKNLRMQTKPTDEAGDTSSQNSLEPTQESSRYELRDLRPEKDPMGAGRSCHPKTAVESH